MKASAISASDTIGTWCTPRYIIDALEADFGQFDIDAAALLNTSIAPLCFAPHWSALDHEWTEPVPSFCERPIFRDHTARVQARAATVYVNPPYGRGEIEAWTAKACEEIRAGRVALVAMLLPVRCEQGWWHDFVLEDAAEVRFIRGRVSFVDPRGKKAGSPSWPSCVVVYRRGHRGGPTFSSWDPKGVSNA